jgi:hypothetical protein
MEISKRVEKFIQDCTMNCSNECWDARAGYLPWLTPDQAIKAVEIAREEMVEKVCEFLENDLCCYIKAQDFSIEHQRLENDLKQAMKDD